MNVIGVILGGGAGTRLQPLTGSRAKPAVPLAGNYRLVDVPISNCINSNILKIFILTQYNSASLHRHIQAAYRFDQFSDGFVQLLAAEQTPESSQWFQGTADAVRQSMHHLSSSEPDYAVVLSGDQLYRIDFEEVIGYHLKTEADITVCATPVSLDEAPSFGILQTTSDGQICRYIEKPKKQELTSAYKVPSAKDSKCFLASMGIYVFNFGFLQELLEKSSGEDFGSDIFPGAISSHRIYGYVFDGYWKDIGTIQSFWQENLSLTKSKPPFCFYGEQNPIYTRPRFLPPSRINNCDCREAMLSEGVIINAASIQKSIIGLRSIIGSGTIISNSIVMGNDYYETEEEPESSKPGIGHLPLGIGSNCWIDRAIIDKNVRIGDNVTISPHGVEEGVTELYTVKDGVIVIPKNTVLPNNLTIGNKEGIL